MDELDALRGMRTALAEEEHPDRIALRTDWRARAEVRPRRGGRAPLGRRRGFRMPLVSLAATAAVAAGAVTVVSVQPDAAPEEATVAQGGNVLLVAAANAQKAPAGKYWHVKRISGEIHAVGGSAANHYKVDSRQGGEGWAERGGKAIWAHIEYSDIPLTPEDRRKWRAAGSPKWAKIPNSEGGDAQMLLDMASPTQQGTPAWYPADDRYFGLTAAQIAALPTDPEALEESLLDLEGDWHAYSRNRNPEPIRALRGQERVRALSDVTQKLLSMAPAPPKVRAAAWRMLAAQPGVRAEGATTDPIGRRGTAVSLPLETTVPLGLYTAPKQLGTYRRQLIVDPAAGTLLAVRDLVATPPKGSRRLPPGDDGRPRRLEAADMPDRFHRPGELAGYEVYQVTEWTDAEPRR
ncbi:CU044_5270 family protein [Actinomadura sp. 21ATH]|uniref:CU044_5270 family protein n=1 Tax=Actinomadura sp. 21ATH TaxID=1735444 RepID=UPI0035C0F58C